MARQAKPQQKKKTKKPEKPKKGGEARPKSVRKWVVQGVLAALVLLVVWVSSYAFIRPLTTPYMIAESRRFGGVDYEWVSMDDIAPVVARSVVAAEDANYCLHWGFDLDAIRTVIEEGSNRGASTITQQVVKNAFLWQGRSWPRKALEAMLVPLVELTWSKRRILEVYLNVAEFDEGIFGVEAAARRYFGNDATSLDSIEAARLAAILPSPKTRDAGDPSQFVQRRAAQIADGAATIARDGRSDCFED